MHHSEFPKLLKLSCVRISVLSRYIYPALLIDLLLICLHIVLQLFGIWALYFNLYNYRNLDSNWIHILEGYLIFFLGCSMGCPNR